jgi:hypothetical protein
MTVATPNPVQYLPAPEGAPSDTPRVFAAIGGVMSDAMPVGKNQQNTQQNYKFRGIDDVMSAMAGPMRKHGVFILPTIAHHEQTRDGKMTRVLITMRYHVYGPAGDCLVAEVPGEASDFADKATNKAQSAALKYLLFTLFMLPVDGRSIDDGDRHHPEPPAEHVAETRGRQANKNQRRQQQPRQQAPQQQARRDYLAEARKANSPEAFAKVRAAATAAGAPAEYVAQLDAVAQEKRAAAAPQPPASDLTRDANADADAAEQRLRLVASRANLPTLDRDFEVVYGLPIEQATAEQLNTFRERIEAAGGAQ